MSHASSQNLLPPPIILRKSNKLVIRRCPHGGPGCIIKTWDPKQKKRKCEKCTQILSHGNSPKYVPSTDNYWKYPKTNQPWMSTRRSRSNPGWSERTPDRRARLLDQNSGFPSEYPKIRKSDPWLSTLGALMLSPDRFLDLKAMQTSKLNTWTRAGRRGVAICRPDPENEAETSNMFWIVTGHTLAPSIDKPYCMKKSKSENPTHESRPWPRLILIATSALQRWGCEALPLNWGIARWETGNNTCRKYWNKSEIVTQKCHKLSHCARGCFCVESFGLSISESNSSRKSCQGNAYGVWNWKFRPETKIKNLSKTRSAHISVGNPWIAYLNARGKPPTMVTARKPAEMVVRNQKISKLCPQIWLRSINSVPGPTPDIATLHKKYRVTIETDVWLRQPKMTTKTCNKLKIIKYTEMSAHNFDINSQKVRP